MKYLKYGYIFFYFFSAKLGNSINIKQKIYNEIFMGLRNWIYRNTGIELKKIDLPFELLELASKKANLENQNILHTIALGSSHGAFSFKASMINDYTFNLCSTSQDLYYSLQLYYKILEKHKKLKKVILFFSIFSFGFDLGKTSDKKICAYFKIFFDIDFRYSNNEIQQTFNNYNKIKIKKARLFRTENGFTSPNRFLPPEHPVEQRANSHLRESKRENEQLNLLIELINNCKKNGQELIVILPPVRSDFKSLIPYDIFDRIYSLKNQHDFYLINLFNSNYFDESDFGDFDHVNINGANKLTKILKDIIIRDYSGTQSLD